MSSISSMGGDANAPAIVSAANCLRIMGHPSRLAIALLLLDGPCAVSVIETRLKLRQPNLSQHLGLLRDANLLTSQRQAKAVVYELASGPVRELVVQIATLFGGPSGDHATAATPAAPADPVMPTVQPAASPRTTNSRESEEASVFAHILGGRTAR